jgi:hypothetical protein
MLALQTVEPAGYIVHNRVNRLCGLLRACVELDEEVGGVAEERLDAQVADVGQLLEGDAQPQPAQAGEVAAQGVGRDGRERLHCALERRAVGVHVRNHLQDHREAVFQ